MVQMAILFDSTRCIGCRGCQVACKQWNDLDGELNSNPGSYNNPKDLSSNTWKRLEMREVVRGDKVDWLCTLWSCFHCTDANCKNACPTEAISHTPEGFVIIDQDNCIGCGVCVDECPFDVMRLGEETAQKCNACIDRIDKGGVPACVKTCPALALMFGELDDVVKEGKERVLILKDNGLSNAYLYGEREQGGLRVMSVLKDYPEVYGLPRV